LDQLDYRTSEKKIFIELEFEIIGKLFSKKQANKGSVKLSLPLGVVNIRLEAFAWSNCRSVFSESLGVSIRLSAIIVVAKSKIVWTMGGLLSQLGFGDPERKHEAHAQLIEECVRSSLDRVLPKLRFR